MKSRALAFILSALFGPLGLAYASPTAAFFMIALTIFTMFLAPLNIAVIWVLSVLIADQCAYGHNKRRKEMLSLINRHY